MLKISLINRFSFLAVIAFMICNTNLYAQVPDGHFGNMKIGTWVNGLSFGAVAHQNQFSQANNYALLQKNDGNTYLNAAAGQRLYLRLDDQNVVTIFDGKMGIGNVTPSDALDIFDSQLPAIKIRGGGKAGQIGLALQPANYSPVSTVGDFVFRAVQDDAIFQAQNGDLRFVTGGGPTTAEKMTVTNVGNVGIGTASPAERLHVEGTARVSNALHLGTTDLTELQADGTGMVVRRGSTALARFNLNGQQVNIGPDQDFVPGFRLSVDGKVIAEELRVQNSTNWPDYVFQSDYDLRTLEEVKSFVETHQHLPEVPSAEEVKDGVDVAEMQKTLLKKVEELTLYLITLDEEVKALQAENAELRQGAAK